MKSWYIIAYDIRDPKRLRKLHYHLRKQAIPMQYSVFLIKANSEVLNKLLQTITRIAKDDEDDIRLYPIFNPNTIWAAGKQAQTLFSLYSGGKRSPPSRSSWYQIISHKLTGKSS